MDKSKTFHSLLIPSITVFFSSACIMILELVAGRLIARHLGASLYTWTSVIGVVLAGITAGNYIGGRIADRHPPKKALSMLFAAASVACVATVVLNNRAGDWTLLWRLSWPVRVFLHVLVVFLLPSMVLGTISPVVAKMALDRGLPTGRTIGDIYAWGAAGSIAGTFLAGFYLIAAMGTITIVWTISAALLIMATLFSPRTWFLYVWAAILVLLMTLGIAPAAWAESAGATIAVRQTADPNILYADETQYCYVHIRQVSKDPDIRLFMQDKLQHSKIIMTDITNVQYPYQHVYAAVTNYLGRQKKYLSTLSIGGGGYFFPRYILHYWPGSRVDVAEIDPGVTRAAEKAFGLPANTTINTFTMDGRNYVDELIARKRAGEETVQYDFIYGDAFNDYSVPHQLVTKEFNDKIAQILSPDGAYMLNMIDIYATGFFLSSVINTLNQTFKNVYVVSDDPDITHRSTFVVIAANRPLDIEVIVSPLRENLPFWYLSGQEIDGLIARTGRRILSDDHAPVENLLAPVLRENATFWLAEGHLYDATEYEQTGQYDKSIEACKKAANVHFRALVAAYSRIGRMLLVQGKASESLATSKAAITRNEQLQTGYTSAPLCLNAALALRALKRTEEAKPYLRLAVAGFRREAGRNPRSTDTLSNLGAALAETGDYKEATDYFRRAIELDTANPTYHLMLAAALLSQKDYDEAIRVIEESIEVMTQSQNQTAISELRRLLESARSAKSQKQ